MIKTGLVAAVLVLAAVVVFVFGALFYRAPIPRVNVEPWHFVQPVIALGTMTTDQSAPVVFYLKNETDQEIKITLAEGECRCTSLESGPDVISAHGIGTFKFVFVAAR